MNFLSANLSILIAIGFYLIIHFYNKPIHQLIRWIILGSLLIVLLVIFVDIPIVRDVIDSGHVSLGFFLIVMFAGVLPKKSIFYKKILLVRGDLAILGFIFLLPHSIERLSLALSGYNTSGLIAMIIMVPLTLSSFMTIRKKIRPDRWKKLHKFAYIAYFMIYLHLGFDISINSSNVYIVFSSYSILYHLLLLIYLVMKLLHIWKKRQLEKNN
jgi:DMSO/TMAO reductase YedYZ heme-binding membrane subunit